jgi:CAAX prenyl protease-like protein
MPSTSSGTIPRVLPFVAFMALIGLNEALQYVMDKGLLQLPDTVFLYLYPVRAAAAGLLLVRCLPRCPEFRPADLRRAGQTMLSLAVGLAVFILWINMDWAVATLGAPTGYDPTRITDPAARTALIAVRLLGAVVVVPVMEELFWRSYLLRTIIHADFESVPVGKFNWPSFLAVTVLFALAHNLVLAGAMAAVAYNLLLYRTKSIAQCVLAHAVTNLALGVYVLATGQWRFW